MSSNEQPYSDSLSLSDFEEEITLSNKASL